MTEEHFRALFANVELKRFLWAQGRRYFRDQTLQDQAVSEAWARIRSLRSGLSLKQYRRRGLNAIAAMYKRRRRNGLGTGSALAHQAPRLPRKAKAPSPLAQLAAMAIAGDW